jgi:mannose-6-phosphate isomerase
VQVHPDDAYAAALGDISGKEEAWYVLEASRGAMIYLGLEQTLSQAELTEAIHRGDFLSKLHGFKAQVGDTYHIPPGVVHALGAGTEVYEVSTASERTFRIYDHGRGRELHLTDALSVLKALEEGLWPALKKEHELARTTGELEAYQLVQGAEFQVQRLRLRREAEVTLQTGGRLWLITCLQGTVSLTTKAEPPTDELLLAPLETVVVPACADSFGIRGEGVLLCAILTPIAM